MISFGSSTSHNEDKVNYYNILIHTLLETSMFSVQKIIGLTKLTGLVNLIALRKAKIVCNFGLSECNRVKV